MASKVVRLHFTFGSGTRSADLRTLDGEIVADGPVYPIDADAVLLHQWAARVCGRKGWNQAVGEVQITSGRRTIDTIDGRCIWLDPA